MVKLSNQFTQVSTDRPRWEKTADGFLRCPARILKEGVMPYHRSELVDVPGSISGDLVSLFVGMDTMSSAASLHTLEGMPVVVGDHCWITPENVSTEAHGNIAGAPRIEGQYLVCDLLITDPRAIASIEAGDYPEISAAYHAEVQFESGSFDGQSYDAKQIQLKYNHVAVISAGSGRAGLDVRILNKDTTKQTGGKEMSVKVRLRNGKFINTDEEGAEAVAEAVAEDTEATETSTKSLESAMDELGGKNDELASLQAEIEELKGQLSVYKEKLDELLSDEAVEGAAAEMVEEQGESDEILENCNLKNSEGKEVAEEEKVQIKNSIKKLRGDRLYREVLGLVGMKCENMSAEGVRGAFKAHVQIIRNTTCKTVAGNKLMNSMISKEVAVEVPAVSARTNREKLGLK